MPPIDCLYCLNFESHLVHKDAGRDEITCKAYPLERFRPRLIIDCPCAITIAGSQDEDWESEHGE